LLGYPWTSQCWPIYYVVKGVINKRNISGGVLFSCMTCEFSGDFLVNKKNAWLISGRILTFNQNRWDLSPSNPDFYIAEARCCFWIEAAKQFLRGFSDIFNPLIQTALVVRKSCPNTDSRVRLATFTLLGQGSVVRLTCLHLAWPPRFRLLFARSGDERGKVMPGGSTHAAHDACACLRTSGRDHWRSSCGPPPDLKTEGTTYIN
jgi:hypothetical protein